MKLVAKGHRRTPARRGGPSQRRRREDVLRLAELRTQIEVGIRDLDAGDFDVVDARDLKQYLDELAPRPEQRRSW